MSFRSFSSIAFFAACLASSSVLASELTVTSYDMNNGNGANQFTNPTGGQNYFDFTYTQTGQSTPYKNANQNGSGTNMIPTAANSNAAPLTGGTGLLTDGVIPLANYSQVSGTTSGQYVGWKYQDPTIVFHLASGQSVGQIKLYVAADNSGGLVGSPSNVTLTTINSLGQSTLISAASYTETKTSYMGSPSTEVITITLNNALSSDLLFSLQLFRGVLEADGIDYYNKHVKGYNPADPYGTNTCDGWCDPDLMADNSNAQYASGFRQYAADGQTGDLIPGSGKEPWILVSEAQFLSAVPEPSTWIMMIAGFFGIGTLAYRRGRKLASA